MKFDNLLPEEKEELIEIYKMYNSYPCKFRDLRTMMEFISMSGMTGMKLKSFLRGVYPYMGLNCDSWLADSETLIKDSDDAFSFVARWNKMINSLRIEKEKL